jgi:DNA repair protein RadC
MKENKFAQRILAERELLLQLLNCFVAPEESGDIADAIFDRHTTLRYICEMPKDLLRQELEAIPGLPPEGVDMLSFIWDIVRASRVSSTDDMKIASVQAACRYMTAQMFLERREAALLFALDEEFHVVSRYILSYGIVDETSFAPGLLLEACLKTGAEYAIIGHNHPGSGCDLSPADVKATENAIRVLSGAGVPLLDHILVAGGKGISMRKQGKISDVLWSGQGKNVPSGEVWLQEE